MSTITQFPSGNTQYRIEFDYLSRTFVVVTLVNSSNPTLNRVLEVGRDYRFLNPAMIEMLVDQSGFDIVRIHRQTGTDLVVDFRNGSVLTASDLTNAELQAIHIAEEGRDQTVDLAKEYADAAGSSAGNAKDSEDEARRIAESIKASGKIGYITRRSFEKGFNVTTWNEVLLWEEDGDYYRWDGTLPKNVPAGSTPETSGGIGSGAWVSVGDASLRQNLGSSDGSKLVGGIGFVSPEMFGYKQGVTPDAAPYLQAAVDYGHEHKIPIKWSGDYYTNTATVDVPLPGDDGTAYPGWVSSGTDANIPEETKHSLKAALRIYSDTKIIGSGSSQCRLIGPWDAANPVIDNQQHVGIYIQANNPIEGYVRYQLSGLTIKGYFVGRFCSNILNHSYEDDLILLDCCFPGIFLGADAVKNGFVTARGCWAAEVYGGWWTNRNAAVTTPYLPPYPAAEIFKIGWVDSLNYEKFAFYGRQRVFGATDIAIDNWFDTYIYKSANSPTTSSGGRRTNNTASGFSSRTFRGVANRAFAVFSRYGRGVNAVTIGEFKSLCTSRVPVYSDNGSQNSVGKAYVERAGLVDTTTSSTTNNEFYVNYTDPRDATYSVPPAMVGQGSMVVDRVVVSAGVATNPYSEAVNESSGPRRFRSFRRDDSDYNMLELSEWNSAIGRVLYRYSFNREFSVQRPVRFFGEDQEAFQYLAGKWTPVVKCGSEVVSGSIATGTWRRVGNLVHVTFRFETSTMSLAAGGAVVISGLPFTVAALNNGGLSVAPVICSRAGSAVIMAETVPGGNTIALLSASSPTAFAVTGGTGLTIYGSVQYVLTE